MHACRRFSNGYRGRILPVMLLGLTMALAFGAAHTHAAGALEIHHDLAVVLDPQNHRLSATDVIHFTGQKPPQLVLQLAPAARILRVALGGKPREYQREGDRLTVAAPGAGARGPWELTIAYTCRFDDPVPELPANADNPGYGVSGTITDQGTLLLAGSGWYPHVDAHASTYRIAVRAPAGMVAVTAGRLLGISRESAETVSRWEVKRPVDGLSLSAGRYRRYARAVGDVQAAVYLFSGSESLAADYLDGIQRYLRLYQGLFGPYPFEKFAVVENFFPTGYGFASYTLLGTRVMHLPFIVRTSLAHEIAHCWWGNGVRVDGRHGNWSEGLTTYVADYLLKEMASDTDAREYRRQALRNYTALVASGHDFPLSRFSARHDTVSKAVGYDKGAMVFHMLRRQVGDDPFWGTLRDVAARRLFQKVSWRELQQAFEQRTGFSLQGFFDQWVFRKGAPVFALEDTRVSRQATGWKVTGSVTQKLPWYDFDTALKLDRVGSSSIQSVSISGARTRFEIESDTQPLGLELDPEVDIFRRLDPVELPPTVNSLRGAHNVLVAVSVDAGPTGRHTGAYLARALGLSDYVIADSRVLTAADYQQRDVLWVGWPQTGMTLPGGVGVNPGEFTLNGRVYRQAEDVLFAVFGNPYQSGRLAGLLVANALNDIEAVCRKIPHYGKYSYLAFGKGQNQDKGTWPVETGPMVVRFPGPK